LRYNGITNNGYFAKNSNIIIIGIITNNGNNVKEDFMPSKAELILHPVRMQIVTTMAAQQMTATEISQIIDIPSTTLYRHINILVEGGILEVVEETQKRGTVEKLYALTAPPSLTSEDLKEMRKKDYEQIFVQFITMLMSDMVRYLDTKSPDTPFDALADGVEVSKVRLLLSDEEYQKMNAAITKLMLKALKNKPHSERKPRIFSFLFIPEELG
jgi:DNA-binding transcriptional ArsR family regulator